MLPSTARLRILCLTVMDLIYGLSCLSFSQNGDLVALSDVPDSSPLWRETFESVYATADQEGLVLKAKELYFSERLRSNRLMYELMARRGDLFIREDIRNVLNQGWQNRREANFYYWCFLANYYGEEREADRLIQVMQEQGIAHYSWSALLETGNRSHFDIARELVAQGRYDDENGLLRGWTKATFFEQLDNAEAVMDDPSRLYRLNHARNAAQHLLVWPPKNRDTFHRSISGNHKLFLETLNQYPGVLLELIGDDVYNPYILGQLITQVRGYIEVNMLHDRLLARYLEELDARGEDIVDRVALARRVLAKDVAVHPSPFRDRRGELQEVPDVKASKGSRVIWKWLLGVLVAMTIGGYLIFLYLKNRGS